MNFFNKLAEAFRDKRVDLTERFQIVREAVNGTMSSFFVAVEKSTKKTYGLKILDTEKTNVFEGRFKSLKKPVEGEIGLKLKHPRIVETYEFGVAKDGRSFILMEYIDGTGLNVVLNQKWPQLKGKRLGLIRQMAEALEVVHKAGFIHRDVCPRNFICAADCTWVKLIDFGLTLPNQREYMMPGNRTGTPLYLAPEIVRRKTTDQRVDIFSFGVTCYQLCTFDFPWPSSDTTGKGALQHDSADPRPILDFAPKLNRVLAKTIMQCLAPEAIGRPASFEAILKTLKTIPADDEGASA